MSPSPAADDRLHVVGLDQVLENPQARLGSHALHSAHAARSAIAQLADEPDVAPEAPIDGDAGLSSGAPVVRHCVEESVAGRIMSQTRRSDHRCRRREEDEQVQVLEPPMESDRPVDLWAECVQ